jgi:hypothetical protein
MLAVVITILIALALSETAEGVPGLSNVSRGLTGLVVSPATIEKDLGRFLWFVETDLGAITVSNPSYEPMWVKLDLCRLSHDALGVLETQDEPARGSDAVRLKPRTFTLPPGGRATVRASVDPAYLTKSGEKGIYASIMVTSRPATTRPAMGVRPVGAVGIPLLVRFGGKPDAKLIITDIQVVETDRHEGRTRVVQVRVRNDGRTHVRASGSVAIGKEEARQHAGGVVLPVALVLPGCERVLEGPWPEGLTSPGTYHVSARLSADGVTVPGAGPSASARVAIDEAEAAAGGSRTRL